MTRIPLPDPATLQGWQREQYERFPSNLTRALVVLDQRLAGALPATANALRTAPLNPALREAIILRVAATLHSPYERFQHLGQAHQHGWTDAEIEHIEAIDTKPTGLPRATADVLHLVDAVIRGPLVDDDTLAAARAVIDDQDLVAVIVLVGHYMTVARITGILDLPLDEEPDSWTTEH